MPGTAPRRVVVFDRIDANRRNTLLMLGIFGLALLPVVGWLSSYLPVWVVMFLPGLMDFMQEARRGFTAYLVLAAAITPVLLAAAMAAGFSARKRGASGIITLGFALLVFLFSFVFFAPLLPIAPDSTRDPLRWILWYLFSDFVVVVMAAAAGASLDRWTAWARTLFDHFLKPSR